MTAIEQSLLKFPCDFPIKVMGHRVDAFAQEVCSVVRAHDPAFDAHRVEMRPSKHGNYLSVTVTVHATSREQLDQIYRALTSHPMVKVVL